MCNLTYHVITGDLNTFSAKYGIQRPEKSRAYIFIRNFLILMAFVEDNSGQTAEREKEDEDTLREWIKAVRS